MKTEIKLGETVYFADVKARDVLTGIVLSAVISQSGYAVYIILDEQKQKHSVEEKRIFKQKEDAQAFLPVMLDIADEMTRLEKAHTANLDSLREKIIGKPEFKEIANEVFNQR